MFRKGDRVSVMGTIDYDQGEQSLFISIDGWIGSVILAHNLVTMVEPKIETGSTVMVSGEEWEVLAVADSKVWAKRFGGSQVFDIREVARIDPPTVVAG